MNPQARDPVELIREIKQGLNVENNFRLLFDRHYAQILRFFRRKGFDTDACRDLTQDTFVSVYRGIRDLRQEEQFESWLFAIAHNVWCSLIESRTAQKRSATVCLWMGRLKATIVCRSPRGLRISVQIR